jgi:hypothetical protein
VGDVIGLQDRQLIENDELIVDLCRFQEGILTERQVRKKHKLDNTTWERLGSDEGDALVEKVEAESIRRQRDGSTKRELAQKHIVRGPEILNSIAADSSDHQGTGWMPSKCWTRCRQRGQRLHRRRTGS